MDIKYIAKSSQICHNVRVFEMLQKYAFNA